MPHSLSGSPEITLGMLWFIMCILNGLGDIAGKPSAVFLMPATDAAVLIMVDGVDRLTGNAVGGRGCVPPPKFSTVAILGSGEDFCGKLPTIGEVVTDAKAAGFC